MELEVKVQQQIYSIDLARGQRGGYGWTIKVRGDDLKAVLADLQLADGLLKADYSTQGGE